MADSLRERSTEILVEHARRALIHDLGARKVDVWLGKDGVTHHDVKDLAMIVIRSLEPVLASDAMPPLVDQLHRDGLLAPPIEFDPNDW